MESRSRVRETRRQRWLQFNPEKIEPVKGQYGFRISYTVVDPNYADKGPKKFDAGKLTSKKTTLFWVKERLY